MAKLNLNPVWLRDLHVSPKRLVSSKNPNWDNRCVGFYDGQAYARSGRLEPAVRGPCAFGKKNNRSTSQEPVQNSFETFGTAAFPIDGNGLTLLEHPTCDGELEEVFPREIVYWTVKRRADEGRIQEACVI